MIEHQATSACAQHGRALGAFPRAHDKPAFFGTFVTFHRGYAHDLSRTHKVQHLSLLMLNTPMLPSGTLHIPGTLVTGIRNPSLCYSHALPLSLISVDQRPK